MNERVDGPNEKGMFVVAREACSPMQVQQFSINGGDGGPDFMAL
jgi:hypothetical protein